jgi:hypothetical protein
LALDYEVVVDALLLVLLLLCANFRQQQIVTKLGGFDVG